VAIKGNGAVSNCRLSCDYSCVEGFWAVLRERVHWGSSQLTANLISPKLFCLHRALNYGNEIVVLVRPIINWLQKGGWSNQRRNRH